MDVRRGACPNCGRDLVRYRTERQQAGQREVMMEWNICPSCRHVALSDWAFIDPVSPSSCPDPDQQTD